jgi:hypothetical protein
MKANRSALHLTSTNIVLDPVTERSDTLVVKPVAMRVGCCTPAYATILAHPTMAKVLNDLIGQLE